MVKMPRDGKQKTGEPGEREEYDPGLFCVRDGKNLVFEPVLDGKQTWSELLYGGFLVFPSVISVMSVTDTKSELPCLGVLVFSFCFFGVWIIPDKTVRFGRYG